MGAVIGHWKNLAEAERLTESQLLPGVVEEIIKRENLLERAPVALAQGKSIKWNREKVTLEADVENLDIGQQMTWVSSMEYDPQETTLKRKGMQRLLDNFIVDVYGTVQNYEAQALLEIKKGVTLALGDNLIYDDPAADSKQFSGLHDLAYIQTGTDLDIDMAGALELNRLRTQIDAMKHGVDIIYMPMVIARRMDAAYQERGFANLGTASSSFAMISYGLNEMGKRIMFFDGIPIVRTDFLVKEDDGSNAPRTKNTAGEAYSIFLVKFGDVFAGNPGLCVGFGDPEMGSQLYRIELFDKLEDYDAKGIRLVSYVSPLLGSKLCLGRIYDVTDAPIAA